MFSKLRQSFRRRSRRRNSSRHSESDCDAEKSDTATLRSQTSIQSSRASLSSSASSKAPGKEHQPQPSQDAQWQRTTPSVVESNRVMFNRQLICDVMFVVGEGRELVGAHRFVLVSRSDVMYRMFCGPLAETGPVVIPDVSEDVFRRFLEFLYVDEVSLTPDNVTLLHYLGRKYDVEPLVQRCLEFLHARLTPDNACSILEQAHCFDEHELYKTSLEFVKQNAQDCLSSVAVNDLCRGCLERILSMDDLDISEQLLFKASLSWAEASLEKKEVTIDAHNVRQELGHLLYLFRFTAMSFTVLKERVFPTEVLTPKEVKAITQYKTRYNFNPDPFVGHGRLRLLSRFQNVSRVRCSNQSEASKWTAAITVSCDWDLQLHAINIFSCTRGSQLANVGFTVLPDKAEIDLYNRMDGYPHTYKLQCHIDGANTLPIKIYPPFAFCANVDYTLVVQADMAACFAGTDGMATVTCDDVTFRFRDAPVKMNGTTVSEGQIPSFVYSVL
ncbi:hypothetical protein ACOMHN_057525 [Nucella lapillus]